MPKSPFWSKDVKKVQIDIGRQGVKVNSRILMDELPLNQSPESGVLMIASTSATSHIQQPAIMQLQPQDLNPAQPQFTLSTAGYPENTPPHPSSVAVVASQDFPTWSQHIPASVPGSIFCDLYLVFLE